MTLSQAFGIVAASVAFVAILVAIGAAVAAILVAIGGARERRIWMRRLRRPDRMTSSTKRREK